MAVVGSGLAGLAAALGAATKAGGEEGASASVLLLTKGDLSSGSSPWARGGLAAAVGSGDSTARHAADTLRVARGIADERAVRELVTDGPEVVGMLLEHGARFDRDAEGRLALGREAGHSERRVLHSGGDRTGAELVRVMVERVLAESRVRVAEHAFAVELVLDAQHRTLGLWLVQDGRPVLVIASQVVLATGGAGQLFAYTTNPPEVTGDGVAMAARAGAQLADLEFVQFHPTALLTAHQGASLPLLTEALRGDGAHLVDQSSWRFMQDVHRDAELAPRDVVARELWQRGDRGEASFLDLRPIVKDDPSELERRFPSAVEAAHEAGLDPLLEPLPVTPAAHYFMGGVWVDALGRTSIEGLWACGETASSGVHGANRLASNSLLEALAFGGRVGAAATTAPRRPIDVSVGNAAALAPGVLEPTVDLESRQKLRAAMWRFAGPVRSAGGLEELTLDLDRLEGEVAASDLELRNMVQLGRLIALAALRRTESRGGHFRADYPEPEESWAHRSLYRAEQLLETQEPALAEPGIAGSETAAPRAAGAMR